MLTWASILAGLAKFAGLVMTYINNRQLLDAGEAKATARMSADEQRRVDDANRAAVRARATVDAHGVPDDFYRRD